MTHYEDLVKGQAPEEERDISDIIKSETDYYVQ